MILRKQHIIQVMLLLLFGGMANLAWAYKVTYHILTLPMSSATYNIKSDYDGKRMEAIRVIVNNATTVELPDHFKSPLAKDFKYYESSQVTKSATAVNLYDGNRYGSNKGYTYELVAEPVKIASTDVTADREIYVTYDYKADNTIAKLDGSVNYNIVLSGGFLCYNRGRNNRPALFPTAKVGATDLISDDFVTVAVNGTNISPYWNDKDKNKNKRADVEGQFHFLFKFIGGDPYNIIVSTAYNKNTTYIEAFDLEGQLYKYYKDSHLLAKSTDNAFLVSDDHQQYTQSWDEGAATNPTDISSTPTNGYFHSLQAPVWNTVALLNNTSDNGFVFMATRYVDASGNMRDPTDNKYYYLQNVNNNNLKFGLTTAADASSKYSTDQKKVYPIKTVNFKVATSFYDLEATDAHIVTASTKLSEYTIDHDPISDQFIPEELKRKYCTFTKFYKDAAHTTEITKFTDAYNDATKKYDVYVDYEMSASAPFKCIKPAATYSADTWTAASWYELTDENATADKKIKYDGTYFKNNGVTATYEKESEYAFIGDPYELRVVLRSTTSGATPYYVGATGTPATGTALTTSMDASGAGYKWDIPYDATDGSMLLRLYKGTGHWYWNTAGSDQNVEYNTENSTRVKMMELPKFTYTYNMVDKAGRIAIKADVVQTVFTPIAGYASIPEDIRSPFLADDETITYYDDNYSYVEGQGRTNLTHSINETPGTANDIFISYTTATLSKKSIKLNNSQMFNVKLNGEYIYWDGAKISSKANPTSDEKANNAYLWKLTGEDPYAMKIYNMGKGSGEYVKVGSWTNDQSLGFDPDVADASRFIPMTSNYEGVYEVLAATGTTALYHIGRASDAGAETKIYSIDTEHGGYAHGADQLRFELAVTTRITYTLVDKAKNELFTVESYNPRLALPSEYQSPLVDTYYYYPTKAKALADNHTDNITEIEEDDDHDDPDENHVWVTYHVNDLVSFNTASDTKKNPYLLRFHNGKKYYLEDGSDKLTGSKIQAMYPYCNGDGNLNIYGEPMRDEQMNGGSSTRPRWQWYFESALSDPYHVKIHSNSQITLKNGGKVFTYFHTYAVHFNQESATPNKKRVVTGSILPSKESDATEYMILGTAGNFKLLTTEPVAADLNGDGDTTDDGENERQYVRSFEQYWKTYNMIKQHLLGLGEGTDEYSKNSSTFVMPSEKWDDLKAALTAKGITDATDLNYVDGGNWHSYSTVANATRWNGYNDSEDGHKSKIVEELEHWFQTFDMQDGTFNIENGDIPPVLVLLDRHGWEIMRKPIPTDSDSDAEAEAKLAELGAFDSPMVKEYTFYGNATKASGCHKYSLRLQKGLERDTIEVDGKRFKSTSLTALPPYKDGRDLFVKYSVKEEYDKSYAPSTKTASKFIILQNHQYATDESATLTAVDAPSSLSDEIIADAGKEEASKTFKQKCLWFVQPNPDIDKEMGYPAAKPATYTDAENGFDPYNVQLKNASTNKFFTIDMKKSVLSGGVYTGDYEGGSLNVTLADANTVPVESTESHDHSTLQMTNQTFMAVQDENGNMQLMPRFDHATRINAFTTLAAPLTNATKADVDDASPGEQTTFMVLPLVYDYRVIDNQGRVALRYQTGGEFYPSMPDHFKSPLAKDFKFYKTAPVYHSDTKTLTVADEITSSFAAAGIQESANIYIRYSYNDTYDANNQNILQGRWLTMSLAGKDVQATGTLSTADGTGVSLYTGTKDAAEPEWQWKFLQSPMASTSELYIAPDPYCVTISNHEANNDDPKATPSKMATAIKVSSKDRFVILSHPEGDYALLAAGDGLSSYSFLNGGSMTTDVAEPKTAASVETEEFSKASNTISDDARIIFYEDVTHRYTYYIINNSGKLAASATQDYETAVSNEFIPVVPNNIQSPIVNDEDYLFYGTVDINENGTPLDTSDDIYTIGADEEKFAIDNLFGLFDDKVYVRYKPFSRDNTPYMVPNARTSVDGHVAKDASSNDVAIDIRGNLPYNIIWYDDNMMVKLGESTISDGDSHELTGDVGYTWKFEGSDPYAIQIKEASGGRYVYGTATLNAAPKDFMLLKRDGYDYGVLAVTGDQNTMLTFGDHDSDAGTPNTLYTEASDPAKFIPFALSVHHLIYHLVINTSKATTSIPYRVGDEDSYLSSDTWIASNVTSIPGTTQRDLTTATTIAGDTYQLGETINGQTYCHDAGKVSIGDVLEVPEVFDRPNCRYYYYIQDVYDSYDEGTKTCSDLDASLNNKYKGLKLDETSPRLMSKSDLIGKTVVVNVTYSFDTGLPTNAGDGFVTDVEQNLWYTFETNEKTPYLAHYTNAWGLQAMKGRDTRYTNDYLWLPLGDPYGFKMYNRYIKKNSSTTGDDNSRMMTTESIGEGVNLKMLEPVESSPEEGQAVKGNEVYELLHSSKDGYFRVHPVINNSGTQYYIRKDPTDDFTKLSETATEWTFGLSAQLIQPYVERVGYVGGLKKNVYDAMDAGLVSAVKNGTATAAQLMEAQAIVYNTDNIVPFATGYYRMHNQPGVSGISTVRYASGYLHDIEKTAVSGGIPMHFYSRKNTETTFAGEGGLTSGFTVTPATRGEIPVPATEYDPSTIFHINGSLTSNPTISTATMKTQGLYVARNAMGDSENGTTANKQQRAVMSATAGYAITFTLMDIGGAVLLIHDGESPSVRRYLNFDQSNCFQKTAEDDADMNAQALKLTSKGTYYFRIGESTYTYKKCTVTTGYVASPETNATLDGEAVESNADEWTAAADIYDLKYYHDVPTDDAKWCMEPVNNQGLQIETHKGGDGYYYTTFCAPFDVVLPDDADGKVYKAYVCTEWNAEILHPTKMPASDPYAVGKFVPAATSVIMRTTDAGGSIKVTLPGTVSSAESCVFTGKYLEQVLATAITAGDKVYTFGLPITGYNLTITDADGFTNGEVNNVLEGSEPADKGVGFYLNANPNKEKNVNSGLWTPNNRYVLHNKIYYRSSESSGAGSRQQTNGVEFIPVVFEDEDDILPDGQQEDMKAVYRPGVYDLQGRQVATEEMVKSGAWRNGLAPGVYILNGRKVMKR